MAKLVLPEHFRVQLKNHLLKDRDEHVAFAFARKSDASDGPVLIVEDIELVPDSAVTYEPFQGICLDTDSLLSVINKAIKDGMTLIEAHSHPLSSRHPEFSLTDESGFEELVPYMLSSLPDRPYLATVWGRSGITGLCWTDIDSPGEDVRIVSIGDHIARLDRSAVAASFEEERYARQVPAFGHAAQRQMSGLQVAVVGLGGLGSHLAQQLAYTGIRDFVLVDHDKVELTNLNRIVGAVPADIGRCKVDVAAEHVAKIAPDACVERMAEDLRHPSALSNYPKTVSL
jgi:hypothetical protein